MMGIIDQFETLSGWVASDPALDLSRNEFPSKIYIGDGSLRVIVPANSKDFFFEKQLGVIDTSIYDDLRLVLQRNTSGQQRYRKGEDFKLKFSVGNTVASIYTEVDEWYVPVVTSHVFNLVCFDVKGIAGFDTIRFTIFSDEQEVYFLDNIVLSTVEPHVDALLALKAELDSRFSVALGKLPQSAVAGSETLSLSNISNVVRFSLLRVTEGAFDEVHQVESDFSTGSVSFSDAFDGRKLLNNYTTDANVSLLVPCQITSKFLKHVEPGIVLEGFTYELGLSRNNSKRLDSYRTAGFVRLSRDDRDITIPVSVFVTCQQPELMSALTSFIVNIFEDDFQLHIAGCKYDVFYSEMFFEEGDLEGESDRIVHKLEVKIAAELGAERTYINFPHTISDLNFNV